jgi:LuxR family maltose regulon positive regulatory protein
MKQHLAFGSLLYNLSMTIPVLATKLYTPPPPPFVIARPRLNDRLNEGLTAGRKLTLISAPAGFGKSTLVSAWLSGCGRTAAWLSLDEKDNDPVRFLLYLISALQKIAPGIGRELMETVQSPQPPPVELMLAALLNEIEAVPDDLILVLDDYHVVDSQTVDEALTFLIEHQPPQMHIVIMTREDPALPIPRLRARNQLIELRAANLRFTPAEATEFLYQVMGLSLSVEQVAALAARTEGWIAGLQLAALSMQGNEDVAGFIRAFAGDHGYIVDYLVEEVLQRQSEPMRSFLLQTSILNRLSGPLCDTVTGQPGGGVPRLEALQRGNFFLIPLDDRRQWYRYHHLFADVLRLHLLAEQPEQVPELHRRASEWYEQHVLVADAIHHALAAEAFERAAGLIQRAMPEMQRSRQEATLLGWFQALPDGLFHNRPVLNVHYAGTLLQSGQLHGVEARLRSVERWLDAVPADKHEQPIFVEEADFRHLPALLTMYQAGLAQVQGDVANTIQYAQQVLERAGADDDFLRGAASALLGLAFWTNGELELAHQTYTEGMAYLQQVGFISDVIGGAVTLADIRMAQGRLREAMNSYERGLQLATKGDGHILRGAADMHVGLSQLYFECNDLESARQHLLKSKELGELNALRKNPSRWRVAMARIREAEGDLDGALELLAEAERLYEGDFSPNVRPIAACKVRLWLALGRLDAALAWVQERKLSAEEPVTYLREFELITLARVLLARYQVEQGDNRIVEAMGLLERLLKAAEAGERMGSVIEILVLQAVAYRVRGDMPAALCPLERALKAAEPEGYVRLFLDEGASMKQLLQEAAARGIMPGYVEKIMGNKQASREPVAPATSPLLEPLSQRELEILRLFKTELSGPEIADELVIALSTVRTHTKGIYSKLNVNSRRTAVKRAIELGLI